MHGLFERVPAERVLLELLPVEIVAQENKLGVGSGYFYEHVGGVVDGCDFAEMVLCEFVVGPAEVLEGYIAFFFEHAELELG